MIRLFLLIFVINFFVFAQEVKKDELTFQGDLLLRRAKELCAESKFELCIEDLHIFSKLYPRHPDMNFALFLLSDTYLKINELNKSIQIDLKIYKNNTTNEDGLTAYLNAGQKYVKIGDIEKGKNIFQYLKTQMYSSRLNKEAEIELTQLKILHEDLLTDVDSNPKIKNPSAKTENQ